jgi:hypothetical protein
MPVLWFSIVFNADCNAQCIVFNALNADPDPDPGFWWQNCKILQLIKISYFFSLGLPWRTSKLQKKPSALKGEHPTQNMKFYIFSIPAGFALLRPISSRSKWIRIHADPALQHCNIPVRTWKLLQDSVRYLIVFNSKHLRFFMLSIRDHFYPNQHPVYKTTRTVCRVPRCPHTLIISLED